MPPSAPSDRRPIAARAACGAGAAFAGTAFAGTGWARALWLLGAALVQVRLLCNLFDGMVAVGRGVASARGELFNEVPDRVSDTAVLCGVGWAAGSPALGIAASLAAMATAYVRALGRGMGRPSDFSGPMAKQQRMAVVTALGVACAVLPAGWTASWPGAALWLVLAGATLTAARRLLRLSRALA